jgi:DNA polymerase-3 subunit gamma/tau
MAYQVFARKYRPQTLAEIVGQEHIVRTLTNAITQGRLAQAYLFVGPRGTGKTSTARILAKALNCPDGPTADFDPNADICQEIAAGSCLDVLEIDGASNNGVDQVRDLRDNVRYTPIKGKFKIYIIDEVHMLSLAAFNALLKTLEEPPAHIKFIFATTEAHKLPATILSRCQRFDFKRIPDAAIAAHLKKICDLEKVSAEPAALQTIARYAEGGLRDAETALDQVISFYGEKISEADVLKMFGLASLEAVTRLAQAVMQSDPVTALQQARTLYQEGKDLGKLTQDLLKFFRNLIIFQISPEAIAADLTSAESEALKSCSTLIARSGAMALLEELTTLDGRLRQALNKDVLFEVALLQMTQLREKVSLESLLARLGSGSEGTVAPTPVPSAPAPVAPVVAPAKPAPIAFDPPRAPVMASAPPEPKTTPAPAAIPSKALTDEDFKNDPLIREAIEIFKAKVVNVAK